LALEFSTSVKSAALIEEGRVLSRGEGEKPQEGGPARLIQDVLAQAGLGAEAVGWVAVGVGPGSYTGVRVAIAMAQGWQLARGVRLLAVSSFQCLLWRAWLEGSHGDVTLLADAQRGEYYAERHRITEAGTRVERPLAIQSGEIVAKWAEDGSVLIGPDLEGGRLPIRTLHPEAGMLGVLAGGFTDYVAGEELAPIYLRETRFVKAATTGQGLPSGGRG